MTDVSRPPEYARTTLCFWGLAVAAAVGVVDLVSPPMSARRAERVTWGVLVPRMACGRIARRQAAWRQTPWLASGDVATIKRKDSARLLPDAVCESICVEW